MRLGGKKAWRYHHKPVLTDFNGKLEVFSSTTQTCSWLNPCQILHRPSVLLMQIMRRHHILFQNCLLAVKGRWNVCSLLLSAAKNTCMDGQGLQSLFLYAQPGSTLLFSLFYPDTSFISVVYCVLFSGYSRQCQLKGRKCAHVLCENSVSAVEAVLLAGRELKEWSF